jgi:hypothetical protein
VLLCYRGPDGHCLGHFCIYVNFFQNKKKASKDLPDFTASHLKKTATFTVTSVRTSNQKFGILFYDFVLHSGDEISVCRLFSFLCVYFQTNHFRACLHYFGLHRHNEHKSAHEMKCARLLSTGTLTLFIGTILTQLNLKQDEFYSTLQRERSPRDSHEFVF